MSVSKERGDFSNKFAAGDLRCGVLVLKENSPNGRMESVAVAGDAAGRTRRVVVHHDARVVWVITWQRDSPPSSNHEAISQRILWATMGNVRAGGGPFVHGQTNRYPSMIRHQSGSAAM